MIMEKVNYLCRLNYLKTFAIMKKVILMLVSILFVTASVLAQNPSVKFKETSHDFGDIAEKGGNVTHEFTFTNVSDKPVTIAKVRASCGCTTPTWTNTPIEPGKTGVVAATYNPSGRPNRFSKTVTVTFAEGPAERLTIKGNVIKGERKIEDEYPVNCGSFLLKRTELNFGNMTLDGKKIMMLDLYNNTTEALTPSFTGLPKYLTASPVVIPAKSEGKVEFVMMPAALKKYGSANGSFVLADNHNLSYKVNIVDDFSNWTKEQKDNAGKLNLSTPSLALNKKDNTAALKISNSGKSELHIKAIQCSNPDVTFSKNTLKIKPEKIADITVKIAANKINKVESADVLIFSNDPITPLRKIKLNIQP